MKIIDQRTTYIDKEVIIEEGVIIYPNVTIRGRSKIAANTVIDSNTVIINSTIGLNNKIKASYIENCDIGNNNEIGPFAHLDNNIISNNNIIGNFVEIKRSEIGNNNKAKHLSYLGDVNITDNVNVGASTIIANYNSKTRIKSNSIIKEGVSIGAHTTLVSPIIVEKNSQIAASTTVTVDIPENSLVIGRLKETIKEDYYKEN